MSELFTWALGRTVDEESTKRCAKREPGRSWEALDGELAAIGVHPHCWPLPLALVAVREAEKNPVPQPIPAMPTVKRGAGEGEPSVRCAACALAWVAADCRQTLLQSRICMHAFPQAHPPSLAPQLLIRIPAFLFPRLPLLLQARGGRSRASVGGGGGVDLDRMGEYELWKHLNDVLAQCSNKGGTGEPGFCCLLSCMPLWGWLAVAPCSCLVCPTLPEAYQTCLLTPLSHLPFPLSPPCPACLPACLQRRRSCSSR